MRCTDIPRWSEHLKLTICLPAKNTFPPARSGLVEEDWAAAEEAAAEVAETAAAKEEEAAAVEGVETDKTGVWAEDEEEEKAVEMAEVVERSVAKAKEEEDPSSSPSPWKKPLPRTDPPWSSWSENNSRTDERAENHRSARRESWKRSPRR